MPPRALRVLAGAFIVLGAGVAGVYWLTRVTPDRVVDALSAGGEIRLREDFRPAGGGPWIIVFGIDGLGSPQFREAVRRGALPRLTALMGDTLRHNVFERAVAFDSMLTVLPSSTIGAWTSLFTGHPPAETGVPGNEWFDRHTMQFYAPAPVSVADNRHTIDMLIRNLLGRAVATQTIFERLDRRSYVSFLPVHRGADLLTTPDPMIVGDLFLHLARGVAGVTQADFDSYATIDRQSVVRLKDAIRQHGAADLQVIYLPGLDMYSHVTSDVLNRQIVYLGEVVDPLIGEVLDLYDELGLADDTYVVLVSDHGHTPVLDDEAHALGVGEEDPPGLMERLGYRVRPFSIEVDNDRQDFQAVAAYQGTMAFLYLADRSACEQPGQVCDWSRPPRMEEDVMPLVRAFHQASLDGTGAPKLRGTLDAVLARAPTAAGVPPNSFGVFDGHALVPIDEFVSLHNRNDLVAFSERMEKLAVGPEGDKAGDIILMARSGLDRPVTERYYFSDLYRSWHGSASAQDSYVPFVVARRGGSGLELLERVGTVIVDRPSQLHVAPVLEALFE